MNIQTKANAKKIELFLPDGDPTGCLICDVANWDGKILRIPKKLLSSYSDRTELQYTGIYFLIGEEDGLRVYIGEAENLHKRLTRHLDEDSWSERIIVTKKENALNKAHAKFLEHHFYKLAKTVDRCDLVNNNMPTKSSISEADEAVLLGFAQNVTDVISAIGYRFLTPIVDVSAREATPLFIKPTKQSPNKNASGIVTNEGFVIMHGSTAAKNFSSASDTSLKAKWQKLHDQGIIKNDKFTEDYLASSPSMAAAMVLGHNANGQTEWKTEDGRELKEVLGKAAFNSNERDSL